MMQPVVFYLGAQTCSLCKGGIDSLANQERHKSMDKKGQLAFQKLVRANTSLATAVELEALFAVDMGMPSMERCQKHVRLQNGTINHHSRKYA